jgi:hypothetical protein
MLPNALNTITRWHSFWDVRVLWNPLRPLIQGHNGNIIKKYVRKELDNRLAEMKNEESLAKNAHSVTSLALEGYLDEKNAVGTSSMRNMDKSFVDIVTNQIRLFLFARNDTSASAIAYTFICFLRIRMHSTE